MLVGCAVGRHNRCMLRFFRMVGAIQPASGVYVTLGNGVMPGGGRHSVHLLGTSTPLPFSRQPAKRTESIEDDLAWINAATSECFLAAFPDMNPWCVPCDADDDWLHVCQYPRVPLGCARTIPSHQVVLRGYLAGQEPCASGADLHRDTMDGGFEYGGCITFFGHDEGGLNQWRDFALFHHATGGRGTAIRVLSGD